MFRIGEVAVLDFPDIRFHRFLDFQIEIGVFFDKFRREFFLHAQHIVNDQHLSVAINTGADADCRNRQGAGDFSSQFFRFS